MTPVGPPSAARRVVPLAGTREVAAAAPDTLCRWAARDFPPGTRAWAAGGAVAVAAPALSRRDRLVVAGPDAAVEVLVRHALGVVGTGYRTLGDAAQVARIADRLGLAASPTFDWMETAGPLPDREGPPGARWLAPGAEAEVAALLDVAAPTSYARPGLPGVSRWAGIGGDEVGGRGDGPDPAGSRLAAVAADAWSAPTVGFVAGVATHPALRGRGLGGAVAAFALRTLLDRHGRVALMVDADNATAIGMYRGLGLTGRSLRAARAD